MVTCPLPGSDPFLKRVWTCLHCLKLVLGHLIVVKKKGSLSFQPFPVSREVRAATFQWDCVRVLWAWMREFQELGRAHPKAAAGSGRPSHDAGGEIWRGWCAMSLTTNFLVTPVTSRGAEGHCKLLYSFSREEGETVHERPGLCTTIVFWKSLERSTFHLLLIIKLLVFYKWKQRILKGNGGNCFSNLDFYINLFSQSRLQSPRPSVSSYNFPNAIFFAQAVFSATNTLPLAFFLFLFLFFRTGSFSCIMMIFLKLRYSWRPNYISFRYTT